MAVEEQQGAGHKSGMHGLGFLGVELDEDKALPGGTVAPGFGTEAAQEALLELIDLLDVHAGDERLCGKGGVGEDDVVEFVSAGRNDGGAFVDFGGIEQVEDGEVLDLEDFVHAFEAESALAVEEIGDVSLFKSGLLSKFESGQFAGFDALPENVTEILLQHFELHGGSIAPANSPLLSCGGGWRGRIFARFFREFGVVVTELSSTERVR